MSGTHKPGELIDIRIESLANDGRGIGFDGSASEKGAAVFVANALPCQFVRARILKTRKNYLEAECVEVLSDDGLRVEPLCSHAAQCGGCPFICLPYSEQLGWKQKFVLDAMKRIGRFTPDLLENVWQGIAPSPALTGFRNKIELAFGQENGKLALGFRMRSSHAVFNLRDCALMPQAAMEIAKTARNLALKWPAKAQARLRFLTLRQASLAPGQPAFWHAVVITGPGDGGASKLVANLAHALLERCHDLATITHDAKRHEDKFARGDERIFSIGRENRKAHLLYMPLGGRSFATDPASFFQVNNGASEILASIVREQDQETSGKLLDLYCGAGAPGQLLGQNHQECLGIELSRASVKCAEKNARAANLLHWRYEASDVASGLTALEKGAWQTVLIDPPREGVESEALKRLLELLPDNIIYISCNPATLARDAGVLGRFYKLGRLSCVDMFPHTPHVECCALLQRA